MAKNRNEITGDLIRTKQKRSSDFDDRFDAIFGKRDFRNRKITQQLNEYPEDPDAWDEQTEVDDNWNEEYIDRIGKNGEI